MQNSKTPHNTLPKKLPKILIALWRFPYPTIDGTRYKILNNIVMPLAGKYEIEFLIVSIEPVTTEQVEYIEKNFGKVHLFRRSKISFLTNFFVGFFKGFLNSLPMQVSGYFLKSVKYWVGQNIQNYDAVYVHEIRMTHYFIDDFKYIPSKSKIIFDFNDAISLNYKQNLKFANFPMNMFYYIEGRRVASYEKKLLGMFENYNVVAKYDKDYLLKMLPSSNSNSSLSLSQNFTTIPHGVSVNNNQNQTGAKNIFFVGSLGYAPNRDAVKYFLKNIWPKIHAILPEVKFFVIGKGYRFGGFEKLPNVYFPGFVLSLVNYINENDCAFMVAPLRFGSGTPSKIIESMSMGLPVITTPVACQGIDGVVNGHDTVLIDSKNIDEWVDSIVHLLNNPDEQKNIGQNAKKFILEHNEIELVQKQWLDVFDKIIKNN